MDGRAAGLRLELEGRDLTGLKAVFLDLGGTLLDGESDREAHRAMLQSFAAAVALRRPLADLDAEYARLTAEATTELGVQWRQGLTVARHVIGTLLEEEGVPLNEDRWAHFVRAYWVEHLRHLRLFPEAEEVLRTLRGWPIHLGLVSDVDEDFLQLCLFTLPLEGYFDAVTTSEEVGVAKPDPRIFRRALAKAHCTPEEAIHVGDSVARDVRGASELGIRTIHIGVGGEADADYAVSSLREALDVLQRLEDAP